MAGHEESAPEINSALLFLVLIFTPGIITYGIIAALAEKKERDNITMFLQIFMYGVFSYLLLYGAHWLLPFVFPEVKGFPPNPAGLAANDITVPVIAWASFFGVIQGLLITANLNRELLLRACRWLGLTTRFGDADVWTFLLNSTATDNWATIRHKDHGLTYQGYVSGFSSGGETRELLLIRVRVFDTASMVEVPGIPFLYLSFKEDDVTLEFGAPPD